jgi:soluble lytic murein transglycosylase-like protein
VADRQALRGAAVLALLAAVALLTRRGIPALAPEIPDSDGGLPEFLRRVLTPIGERIRAALAPVDDAIQAAAATFSLDPDLLRAIVWQESRGDPLAARFEPKISDTSYGLGQVLLGTARDLGFAGTVQELLDPATNLFYAAKYLRSRFDRYPDFRLAVASYNSGSPIFRNGLLANETYVADIRDHLAALKGEMIVAA